MTRKPYGYWRTGPIARFLDTLPGKAASHWLFQGMLIMDRTERAFKIASDAAISLPMALVLRRTMTGRQALILGCATAHTLNLLVNGQLMVVLKFHRTGGPTTDQLHNHLIGVGERLGSRASIHSVSAYGSLSRGELHDGSDLDVAVLRNRGFFNGLDACFAVASERARATLMRIPLDIYVWDSPARASRMRRDESPVDLRTLRQS